MLEKTNLKDCFCKGVKPTIAYKYEFNINEDEHIIDKPTILGNELHQIAGTSSDTHFIRMVTKKGKIAIGPLVEVDLTECGIERFIILPYVQETLDLETCYCDGVQPYITYEYLIKVNRQKYKVNSETITREEILKLVGKDPNTHRLRMFTKDGKIILKPNQEIDLTKCGVERFVYEALDCTEGFLLEKVAIISEVDKVYLESLENKVEIIKHNNLNWVVIRDLKIPTGYNLEKADVAVMIPPHYPTSRLDMIYFYPALRRTDGKQIGALSSQPIEGKNYQRWSRHRTANNVWNPETDDIQSHLDLMFSCLEAEFNKR